MQCISPIFLISVTKYAFSSYCPIFLRICELFSRYEPCQLKSYTIKLKKLQILAVRVYFGDASISNRNCEPSVNMVLLSQNDHL